MTNQPWPDLGFGRHGNLSVAELVIRHPSYFFWAMAVRALERNHVGRAREVDAKARAIRIPAVDGEPMVAVYEFAYGVPDLDPRLARVRFISAKQAPSAREDIIVTELFDLSVVTRVEKGNASTEADGILRRAFGTLTGRLSITRRFCDRFFDDDTHFDGPTRFRPRGFLKLRGDH